MPCIWMTYCAGSTWVLIDTCYSFSVSSPVPAKNTGEDSSRTERPGPLGGGPVAPGFTSVLTGRQRRDGLILVERSLSSG